MDYSAPYGSPDPNAAYVDRNTPGAVRGSVPTGRAIEHPQREIMAVIAAAGLAPSTSDLTQLLQAINALIAAATGGSGDPNYVLMTQARVRLPIFPEILTADGKLPLSAPSTGTIRVPAGYDFLHRGIFNVTTVQTDLSTAANKTYHLRWTPGAGFALKDLADGAYNPTAAAETDAAFDSAYDSMLVARITTSAGNVATITPLANKARLLANMEDGGAAAIVGGTNDGVRYSKTFALNWSRTPFTDLQGFAGQVGAGGTGVINGQANNITINSSSRYALAAQVDTDYLSAISVSPVGALRLMAQA